jgi:hypothetical protein
MKLRLHFSACCFAVIAFFVLPKLSFAAGDRYWVGGSGQWSNTAHWSTTSGGSGGASLPDSQTSCFFDANSFSGASQTVALDTDGVCWNVNWTGATHNPTFNFGTSTLTVGGVLTQIAAMSFGGSTGSVDAHVLTLNPNTGSQYNLTGITTDDLVSNGSAGNLVNVTGNLTVNTELAADYLDLTNSTCAAPSWALCYAGAHSTNGGNSGWTFTAPAAPIASTVAVFPNLFFGASTPDAAANWIVVQGHYAYTANFYDGNISNATTGSISVLDVSNPAAPVNAATITFPFRNLPTAINVSGSYAYVTDFGYSGLTVLDVSNPANPVLVSTSPLGNGNIAVSGDFTLGGGKYAYILNGTAFKILDVSNAASTTVDSTIKIQNDLGGIYTAGHYAYISPAAGGLYVVDIANPFSPGIVASTTFGVMNQNDADSVFVSGNYAYVTNFGGNCLYVVDVSNPHSPTVVGSVPVSGGPAGIFVAGHYAYVTEYNAEAVAVVDVANPASPELVETHTTSGFGNSGGSPNHVFVAGQYAYTANYDGHSVSILNVFAPTSPSPRADSRQK